MTEPDQPHDAATPDAAETDPAALSAAEDLDEDELQADPLEAGMDPPEHWSGVTKYGMTPREEADPRPLDERLAEERPDPATRGRTAQPGSGRRCRRTIRCGHSVGGSAKLPGPSRGPLAVFTAHCGQL
ncbi:hypothetical protein AB0K15_46945 [Amycolatopsis sp. NPDC049253]|uniref:hypothetical protein n=1 Tax=Amycolatopsis sp. NPDC049253 TaxID=3155274 RepID=UPI003423CF15